jgi:multidrug resistance efflux pump
MARPRPIRTPLRQRIVDLPRGKLQLFVWLGLLALSLVMLEDWTPTMTHIGLARANEVEITSRAGGRIDSILVHPFETVVAGDVIAVLDGNELEARIKTASARIEELRAELSATSQRLIDEARTAELDRVADLRSFRSDEETLRLDSLALAVQLEGDRIERQRIDQKLQRTKELAEEGLESEAELDDLTLQIRRLDAVIALNEERLKETEETFHAAADRRVAFEALGPADLDESGRLEPLRAAITVETLRLEELRVQREELVLRTPIAGRVRQVRGSLDQALLPGEPVAVVTDPVASQLVVYLPETGDRDVTEGTLLLVARASEPRVTAESVVTLVGPSTEQLPQRLWRDPTIPEFGIPVLTSPVHALRLAPGEPVVVEVLDEESSTASSGEVPRAAG